MNNLAIQYEATGKYEAAEPFYRQALEIRRKLLGPNSGLVGYHDE